MDQMTLEYGRQPGLDLGTLEYGMQPGLDMGTLEYGRQPGLELGTLEYGRQPGLDQRLAPGVEQWRVQARLGPDNLYTSPENYLVMSQNPANNR